MTMMTTIMTAIHLVGCVMLCGFGFVRIRAVLVCTITSVHRKSISGYWLIFYMFDCFIVLFFARQAHASDITDEEEEESIAGRSLNDDDSSIGLEAEETDRSHATPVSGDISTASAMAINSLFDTELVSKRFCVLCYFLWSCAVHTIMTKYHHLISSGG